MKLERILENLNSFEKNSFLKIIDGIVANNPKNAKEIEKLLNDSSGDLKNMDNINVAKVFNLVEHEFASYVKEEFINTTSQLDILTDIISRDGNCLMKQDWFARLYEKELKDLDKRLKQFKQAISSDKSDIEFQRQRDYKIYQSCLETAYCNDDINNVERKITTDEQSILVSLSQQLELSQEEIKLINYLIIPVQKQDIGSVINDLKTVGVIFYSKKNSTIYVADEVVRVLRKVRGKEIADKFFRRILRLLREPQINLVCKKHNIDKKLSLEEKIKKIITTGISFSGAITNDIHRDGTNLTERKKFLNELCDKGLQIKPALKGSTLEEKLESLISYFDEIEKDERVGISLDGYEKLSIDLKEFLPNLNQRLKDEFELQDEVVLRSHLLLDYNIKPRDVLEIVAKEDLLKFCKAKEIKARGDVVLNILDAYRDSENLYLENYENIGFRNLAALKENSIVIKEADLGNKFEELTKTIFTKLGFDVDEKLRRQLNTKKDKIDIILNLGNNDLILIECKTVKESGYNKFSSVSRQLKSYTNSIDLKGFKVVKSLLIAPDFSDDFVKDCGLELQLNLSLIAVGSLLKILDGFKDSKHKTFPYNLLMRDVLIQEDRVLKAIGR